MLSARERLLKVLAAVVGIVAALHLTASIFDLYWRLWWLDIPAHLLGGIFAGLLAVWILFFSGYLPPRAPSWRALFSSAILGAIIIGAGWEVFERMLGLVASPFFGYALDTAKDLLVDTLGGFAAALFLARHFSDI